MVVAGLLFLAFAYFAVGQAAVNRNGAQTAADAAALAAAQETRDELADLWKLDVKDPSKWLDLFQGVGAVDDPCPRADELAAQNDASLRSCESNGLRFRVTVQTNKTAGDSVIPITSTTQAHASATAVIDALCHFDPQGEGEPSGALPKLQCKKSGDWTVDPEDLESLPGPEDLFDVHLAND